jgi:hypothetical protein
MNSVPLPIPNAPEEARVTRLVPMAHVADVDRSAQFYSQLGFHCDSRFSSPNGVTNWAAMTSGSARLFLSRASGPIDAGEQAVLFYLYSNNVRELRAHLLAQGCSDQGNPPGEVPEARFEGPPAVSAVFNIVPRFYMPEGELRIHDPDGYVLLVGQMG